MVVGKPCLPPDLLLAITKALAPVLDEASYGRVFLIIGATDLLKSIDELTLRFNPTSDLSSSGRLRP